MYPRLAISGQLFLGNQPGPLFIVREIGQEMFQTIVTSHLCGEIIAKSDILVPFKTVGEAVNWAYEYQEY